MVRAAVISITIVLMCSCKNNAHDPIYYYSDKTQITDSSTINFITEEYDQLNIKGHHKQLQVYTSLKNTKETKIFIDSIREAYIKHLKNENPEKQERFKHLPVDLNFNCEYIILENSTGRAIEYFKQSKTGMSINQFSGPGVSFKILSFLHALEKEYDADDSYVAYKPSIPIEDTNGNVVFFHRDGKAKLKKVFSTIPGGEIPSLPSSQYTYAEWRNFEIRKDIDLEITDYGSAEKYKCFVRGRFIDIIDLYQAFRTGGIKHKRRVIETVKNSGKEIYTHKDAGHKVMDSTTCDEMVELLRYYKTDGIGQRFVREFDLEQEELIFWGKNQSDIAWVLYSSPAYTIGIMIHGRPMLLQGTKPERLNGYYPINALEIILPILEKLRNSTATKAQSHAVLKCSYSL